MYVAISRQKNRVIEMSDTPLSVTAVLGGVRIKGRLFDSLSEEDVVLRHDLTLPADAQGLAGLHYDPDSDALVVDTTLSENRAARDQEVLTEMSERLRRDVDRERDRRLAEGMTYTMPGGDDVHIPLADAGHLDGIRALVTQATALIASGDTTTTVAYGDMTDGEHDLTGAEMIAFGQAIMGTVQAFYAAARAKRNEVKALVAGTGTFDAKKQALRAYDMTTGWPTEAT